MMKEEMKKQIHQFAEMVYKTGYEDAQKDWHSIEKEEREMNYNKGLHDAWECAKMLRHPSYDGALYDNEKKDIFGYISSDEVLTHYTASEAIAKIKAYEEQENEIHVGDEVVSDAFDEKGIVTHITDKNCVSLICGMSSMINTSLDKVHKTGKSYPQIVEILEQLKGDKE